MWCIYTIYLITPASPLNANNPVNNNWLHSLLAKAYIVCSLVYHQPVFPCYSCPQTSLSYHRPASQENGFFGDDLFAASLY